MFLKKINLCRRFISKGEKYIIASAAWTLFAAAFLWQLDAVHAVSPSSTDRFYFGFR